MIGKRCLHSPMVQPFARKAYRCGGRARDLLVSEAPSPFPLCHLSSVICLHGRYLDYEYRSFAWTGTTGSNTAAMQFDDAFAYR